MKDAIEAENPLSRYWCRVKLPSFCSSWNKGERKRLFSLLFSALNHVILKP
jgi:hypothetical protein